jgi:hypothetical protein
MIRIHRAAGLTVIISLAAILFSAQASAQVAQQSPQATSNQRPIVSQDHISESPVDTAAANSADQQVPTRQVAPQRVADGLRHGLPPETYAVVPGTRFLVALEQDLSTKEAHQNQEFRVRTVEPLEAGSGIYLPSGAVIKGHVSRVERADVTGKAKLWLTFDELHARFGTLPIVADVVSVPGDHSLKTGPLEEGVIQGRSGTEKDAAQAAAAGAAKGAEKGVKDKNKKEAVEGAAMGALEAYLVEAGRGQELQLPKGQKLELELGRALYLLRE